MCSLRITQTSKKLARSIPTEVLRRYKVGVAQEIKYLAQRS